ncbi:Coniferyl alcohol acyltransferase [Linum perenne]
MQISNSTFKMKVSHIGVRVTELRCDGILVGCSFDHRITDVYSCNMFLVTWAELAQSRPISTPPSLRRSLLNPRRPLTLDPTISDMYVPISTLPPPPPPSASDPVLASTVTRFLFSLGMARESRMATIE